jgi:hypothetical protein
MKKRCYKCAERIEVKERIIRKLKLLKYNEPLDREMRIVNMIVKSAINIVRKSL